MTDEEITTCEFEEYTFTFSREELDAIYAAAEKSDRRRIVPTIAAILAASIVMFLCGMALAGCFLLGFLAFYAMAVYKSVRRSKANRADTFERVLNSVYRYRFFEDELESDITHGVDRSTLRIPYTEMKPLPIPGDFAAFYYCGKIYFLRRDAAAEGTRLAQTVRLLDGSKNLKAEKLRKTALYLALSALVACLPVLCASVLFYDYVTAGTLLSLLPLAASAACLVSGIRLKKQGGKAGAIFLVGVCTLAFSLINLLSGIMLICS